MSKPVDLNRVFDDFDSASADSGGGNDPKIDAHVIGPADSLVEIVEISMFQSEQFDSVYFKVQFTVLESDNDKVVIGRTYAWVHDMLNKWFGQSGVKNFIAGAVGLDKDGEDARAIDRKTVEETWSDAQPLKGMKCRVKTVAKTTKGNFEITPHDWRVA